MPPLIAKGPDLPPELLAAQADGELVLFCGAGVSVSAGLPLFKGLVQKVCKQLGITKSQQEKKYLRDGSFELILQQIEREHGTAMRKAVVEALRPQPGWKPEIHQALLTLAESTCGLRLVTTNFDRLFIEAADPRKKLPLDVGPKLPVPRGDHWTSLVHLHGLIQDDDPDGRNLILTSADFGRAYLLDGWASRFVAELFRNFTVLFVGYSVSDPVMRYLTDALAAERERGQPFREPYALAGVKDENEKLDWEAKGLRVIPYTVTNDDHSPLYATIKEWAGLHVGGLTARKLIVLRLAPSPPAHPLEDDAKLMAWALSELSGRVAQAFARLDPAPPFEWLDLFEKSGLNLLSLEPPIERDHLGKEIRRQMPLLDNGWRTASVAQLSPVTRAIGAWLCQHLEDPRLIDWVISRGGSPHPQFADLVHAKLKDLSEPFARVWQSLVGDLPLQRTLRWRRNGAWVKVQQGPFDDFIRLELLHGLTLVLNLTGTGALMRRALKQQGLVSAPPPGTPKVRDLVDVELSLLGGLEAETGLHDLLASPEPGVLAALVEGISSILRNGLDLLAHFEGASANYDPMVYGYPSISPHEQNRYGEPWFLLVDVLRDGMAELVTKDLSAARRLLASWQAQKYPIFRRLVLHVVTEHPELGLEPALHILLREGSDDLWSSTCKREVLRFLRRTGIGLSEADLTTLLEAILGGPDPVLFRDDLSAERVRDLQQWLIWHRLSKLRQGEVTLPPAARLRLEELEPLAGEPLAPDHRDEFSSWMGPVAFVSDSAATQDQFDAMNRESAQDWAEALRASQVKRPWQRLAREKPLRMLRALKIVGRDRPVPPVAWTEALRGFTAMERAWTRKGMFAVAVSKALASASDATFDQLTEVGASWLEHEFRAPELSKQAEYLWPIWDRIIDRALAKATGERKGLMQQSLNTAAGLTVQALLSRLWAGRPQRGSGLPHEIRSRLEYLVSAPGHGGLLARVRIFSALSFLFDVDPVWSITHLIPPLGWRATEARFLWEAYLWNPRWSPGLVAAYRASFLATLEHLGEIPDVRRNGAQLLVAISLYYPKGFSRQQVQRALAALAPADLAQAAESLRQFLEGAEKPELTWRRKIGPWIRRHWPSGSAWRSPGVTVSLALLATTAGEAFPDAVQEVLPYLTPVEGAQEVRTMVLDRSLARSKHPEEFPAHTLDLLASVVPSQIAATWHWRELGGILSRLATADPDLARDPRFRRLRDLAPSARH